MVSNLAKIALTVGVKLLTDKFLISVVLHVAEYLSKKTTNDLDDKIVAEIREALK